MTYQYGNLVYDQTKGWVFVEDKKEENLETETLVGSLNYLGKKGWDVVAYNDDIGFILRIQKNKK